MKYNKSYHPYTSAAKNDRDESMGRANRLHVLTFPSRGKVRRSPAVKNAFTRHHNRIGVFPDSTGGASCIEIIGGGTIGLNRIMSAVSGAAGGAAGALWGAGDCNTVAFY